MAKTDLGNTKLITDPKLLYLIRTLSRTNRKDYENYVINTIWNKLDNDRIEVVSQQYINNPKDKRKHYFIDLYFPALNIGIECDEAHHLGKDNKIADKKREETIFDVLHEIKNDGYKPIHIDVTQSFDNVQRQIDDAVKFINEKYRKNPTEWNIESAKEYYAGKSEISIYDKKGFRTINEACNILFSTGYSEKSRGSSKSYFTPRTFKSTDYEGFKVWFPKLAIKIKVNGKEKIIAVSKGWNNQMNSDGTIIVQFNENENHGKYTQEELKIKDKEHDHKTKIVFAQYKEPLGTTAYKFVGIFILDHIDDYGKEIYTRDGDKCQLIK
jgi:very-short-patch-repair endonuclease